MDGPAIDDLIFQEEEARDPAKAATRDDPLSLAKKDLDSIGAVYNTFPWPGLTAAEVGLGVLVAAIAVGVWCWIVQSGVHISFVHLLIRPLDVLRVNLALLGVLGFSLALLLVLGVAGFCACTALVFWANAVVKYDARFAGAHHRASIRERVKSIQENTARQRDTDLYYWASVGCINVPVPPTLNIAAMKDRLRGLYVKFTEEDRTFNSRPVREQAQTLVGRAMFLTLSEEAEDAKAKDWRWW